MAADLGTVEIQLTYHKILNFLQAVVDDKRDTVREILDSNPELLITKPPASMIVESKYTWQLFVAEDALSMAAKRQQLEMVKLLLPYFDKLTQTEMVKQMRADGLAAWKPVNWFIKDVGQKDIVIPEKYTVLAENLLDTFVAERFHNIEWTYRLGRLSFRSEAATFYLRENILIPEKAIVLDDFYNPELLLLALYETYFQNTRLFPETKHQDAFCIRVIGITQSVLTPETAKVFCHGLDNIIWHNEQINERANLLKLKRMLFSSNSQATIYRQHGNFNATTIFDDPDEPDHYGQPDYYRKGRSIFGINDLGNDYYCTMEGRVAIHSTEQRYLIDKQRDGISGDLRTHTWKKYLINKTLAFQALAAEQTTDSGHQ